jgi:N-methylhydantoinase B
VLRPGDILRLETGGGGGNGHPFDRPAAQVVLDVQNGFVSPAMAQSAYGVALVDGMLDSAATAALRAERPVAKAFHRRDYVDALV